MNWSDVGAWIKQNAGTGAALVGSLLTGNIPAAVGLGVSLVSGATGEATPEKVMAALQTDPATVIRLKELATQGEANIRSHIQEMARIEAQDAQAEHHETQETVRAGDRAEDRFVRWTRPGQSWLSLGAAIAYVFTKASPDFDILALLLTLPLAYAGLREFGKRAGSLKALSKKG